MPKAEKTKKVKREKTIHPNSRKASQLSRAVHKYDKRLQRKEELDTKVSKLRDKTLWFQCQLDEEKQRYSLSEVSELISRYINRFGERLTEIKEASVAHKEQGRHGHIHSSEEDAIKMVYERENEMFCSGQFEAPDMTNRKNMKTLKAWDGDVTILPSIKMKLFKLRPASNMDVEQQLEDNEEQLEDNEEQLEDSEQQLENDESGGTT